MEYSVLTLDLVKSLVPPALALLAATVSVYLTNRLTFDRNHREKMADLRRIAYSAIISEMLRLEASAEYAMMHLEEIGQDFKHDKRTKKIDEDMAEAVKAMRLAFQANYLLLSKEFIRVYDLLGNMLRALEDYPGHKTSAKLHPVIKPEVQKLVEVAHLELNRPLRDPHFKRIRSVMKWLLDPATWSRRVREARARKQTADFLEKLKRFAQK